VNAPSVPISGRPLSVRYAWNPEIQCTVLAKGRNYWYAYIREILTRLGVDPRPLPLQDCGREEALSQVGVLFLGNLGARDLPSGAASTLAGWVEAGGILIGLATEGLDDLFGVTGEDRIDQEPDPFSISAYLEFLPSPVTRGCRATVDPEQRLILTSPVRLVRTDRGRSLARLFARDPEQPGDGHRATPLDAAGIVHRESSRGHAFYFAFDLAQTMWVLLQGRPVDYDRDGDGYLRRGDASPVAENSRSVPYADAFHFLLANMIGRLPVPFVDPIPPQQGQVAPALLYFGGDDECTPGIQVPASDFMAGLGLPYHLNLMPVDGRFAVDEVEQARIEANGHELAVHFNFVTGYQHPCGFTREELLAQAALFRQRFGRDSVCGVNHSVRWVGWAEPGRWMREAGCKADNSFFGWTSPPTNPVNTIGFVHGSAFPRHLWDDAAHGNERLDLVEIPITGYEVGYLGEEFQPERVREALALALQYRLTFEFFYHPVYIARYPACRQAIEELVRLMRELPVPPVTMGLDQLYRWWAARDRAVVHAAAVTATKVRVELECDGEDGFVVRLATGEAPAVACRVDGAAAAWEDRHDLGQHWALVPVATGRHLIEVALA
jgi:hypothetical protein